MIFDRYQTSRIRKILILNDFRQILIFNDLKMLILNGFRQMLIFNDFKNLKNP